MTAAEWIGQIPRPSAALVGWSDWRGWLGWPGRSGQLSSRLKLTRLLSPP